MQGLTLDLPAEIKALYVRITTVINESRFISVEHTVYTKWKELAVVNQLYAFFSFLT